MADGPLWCDIREPIQTVDMSSITLTTTQKMLWTPGAGNPAGNFPANYWTVKKTVMMAAAFKWTSGTGGNNAFGTGYRTAEAAPSHFGAGSKPIITSVRPFLSFTCRYCTISIPQPTGTL